MSSWAHFIVSLRYPRIGNRRIGRCSRWRARRFIGAGFSAWDAAACGVVWHAMTGEAYVSQNGERTLTAREICDWLPEVLTC